MDKQRGNQVTTKLFRVCYTSVYALFISVILNEYCSAKNETTSAAHRNVSDSYRILSPSSWIDGYNSCKHNHNLTMASAYDIRDMSIYDSFNLENHLPVWIYAFEVVLKSGLILRIQSNEVSKYNNTYNCTNIHGERGKIECCSTFIKVTDICQNGTISKINPQSTEIFAQNFYTNATVWINIPNITDFINENDYLKAQCLVWDRNELWTDDCTKTHRTLCIQGNTQPVIQYVKQQKLPEYKPTPTIRYFSSKSSGSPSKQDINNTYHFTTVSSSTKQVPVYQDIWMDPDVRYALIAVGSVIGLVLCLILLCCCCSKYRRNAENKRNSAHLVDGYSETADSIVMKETSVYETADTSEYAIPEDALKKAKHRQSVGENEYDVLQKPKEMHKKYTGNAYNHVTIVNQKDRLGSSNQEENVYDVTNYGKQNSVIVSPKDLIGNIYGDVALQSTVVEKKEEKGS